MKPRLVACSAYSPKLTRLPTWAMPRLRPFCCFLNLVRFGCSISVLPTAPLPGGLLILALLRVQIEDVAGINPYLDADLPVGRLCGRLTVIHTGTQRMQRHATLAVPLRSGDVGAVEPAADLDLDALRSEADRVTDGALHGAAEHDPALELLRNAVGDQLGVELRLADFADADGRRNAQQIGQLAPQPFDILALLADHDARPSRVDRDLRLLGRALDMDATDRGLRQLLGDVLACRQIAVEVVGELLALRVPARTPILGDAEPDSGWMYLLTHNCSLLLRHGDRDVAGPLQNPRVPALGPRTPALERRPFVDHDPGDLELVDIGAVV